MNPLLYAAEKHTENLANKINEKAESIQKDNNVLGDNVDKLKEVIKIELGVLNFFPY